MTAINGKLTIALASAACIHKTALAFSINALYIILHQHISIWVWFCCCRLKADEWLVEVRRLRNLLDRKLNEILNTSVRQTSTVISQVVCDKLKQFTVKAIEHEVNKALGK